MKNQFNITFCDNGQIRMETGEFSPAIHAAADKFLITTLQALGATDVEKTRAEHTHSHVVHQHHDHQH